MDKKHFILTKNISITLSKNRIVFKFIELMRHHLEIRIHTIISDAFAIIIVKYQIFLVRLGRVRHR